MPTERSLTDFAGTWHIDRDIRQADGTSGHFTGTVRFRPDGAGALDYVEEGNLILGGGPPMRATRRYRWTPGLEVYFEDGRFFHRIPAAGGATEHHCAPDLYQVAYDFSNWPKWSARWNVTGPRKDYVMTSVYRPVR